MNELGSGTAEMEVEVMMISPCKSLVGTPLPPPPDVEVQLKPVKGSGDAPKSDAKVRLMKAVPPALTTGLKTLKARPPSESEDAVKLPAYAEFPVNVMSTAVTTFVVASKVKPPVIVSRATVSGEMPNTAEAPENT